MIFCVSMHFFRQFFPSIKFQPSNYVLQVVSGGASHPAADCLRFVAFQVRPSWQRIPCLRRAHLKRLWQLNCWRNATREAHLFSKLTLAAGLMFRHFAGKRGGGKLNWKGFEHFVGLWLWLFVMGFGHSVFLQLGECLALACPIALETASSSTGSGIFLYWFCWLWLAKACFQQSCLTLILYCGHIGWMLKACWLAVFMVKKWQKIYFLQVGIELGAVAIISRPNWVVPFLRTYQSTYL